jgi:hypothetical protein
MRPNPSCYRSTCKFYTSLARVGHPCLGQELFQITLETRKLPAYYSRVTIVPRLEIIVALLSNVGTIVFKDLVFIHSTFHLLIGR